MLEASWRTADAVVAQKTRQTDPKDFWVGISGRQGAREQYPSGVPRLARKRLVAREVNGL
jgi:hypothetical protein